MRISVLIVDEAALSAAQETEALARLPPTRRQQLLAWPDEHSRHRSLIGSSLLRRALARIDAPAGVFERLSYPASAKPRLEAPFEFSLAHCDGRVVCAVTRGAPVGVDVERVGKLTAGTSSLYLSAAERAWAGDDPLRFYTLWTRKEAAAKAAGTRGLRDLRSVQVEGEQARVNGATWHTFPLEVGPGFVAQLACAEPHPIIELERLSLETLL